jgi:hypothetical protein
MVKKTSLRTDKWSMVRNIVNPFENRYNSGDLRVVYMCMCRQQGRHREEASAKNEIPDQFFGEGQHGLVCGLRLQCILLVCLRGILIACFLSDAVLAYAKTI